MPDVHDIATRSRNMSAIKAKNTRPELIIRKLLHKNGFRYKVHDKLLPGKPDLVFPKYNAVAFINGCFWHHHDCHLFKWPQSRSEFWHTKISNNLKNDQKNYAKLRDTGWRISTIWECALKGKTRIPENTAMQILAEWLKSDGKTIEIQGLSKW